MSLFTEMFCSQLHAPATHQFVNKSQVTYLKQVKEKLKEYQCVILCDSKSA